MGDYERLYRRPFYERVWFIVLMFLVFWPVGLVLLVIRVSEDRNQVINICHTLIGTDIITVYDLNMNR